MAPVIKALASNSAIEHTLVSTGQHREMIKQVFDWFNLSPDHDLAIMQPGQTLSGVLSRALDSLDALFVEKEPDVVLAQGDTTTVLAASLAAFHRRIPFGHVEAGLRTYDLGAPFPEEANRSLVGRIAKWHFAPTPRAVDALAAERVPGEIHLVGNTVVDALLDTANRVGAPSSVALERERMVLITGHRRENHGERFDEAFRALGQLARDYPDVDFVYPVHLNPNVREAAFPRLKGLENFHLIDPVPYPEMIALMRRAQLILTDSGGVQEEAPSLQVPVLVMRDTTERPEAVEAGVCELVGVDFDRIVSRASAVLDGNGPDLSSARNPFGDGRAAERIVTIIAGGEARFEPSASS